MSLTTAMFTGLTGLNANQIRIDTIGDNIANINTTAFKGSRAMFESQFSLTLSGGTAPSATSGGTNPSQIGMGTGLSAIQRNLLPGPIETTGVPTDLAIEGNGFFVVAPRQGQQAYTRDGSFRLNANHTLVTAAGARVLGYGVNDNFEIQQGVLGELNIPLGSLSLARQTTEARFDGNLNANGPIATHGTILHSIAFEQGPGAPATAATLLTNLFDPATPGSALFEEGDVITIAGATKGGRQLPEVTFEVTANSTLGDFLDVLNTALGINEDPALGGEPGIRISDEDPPGQGVIIIEGNAGTANALELNLGAIRSSNENFPSPFQFDEVQEAVGESLHTSFIAFDSLGTPVRVDVTLALESKTNAGNIWRFYTESFDDSDDSAVLGLTGTLMFDTDGQVRDVTNNMITIDRAATGALTPLQMTLDFSGVTGLTTQNSSLVMTNQDGFPAGTLTSFGVGNDGVIYGGFSNGLTRPLGQVAMATFTNPEGLVGSVNNLFLVGPNSGEPIITSPGELGAGRVIGGALEMSNVDLTREFIGLITATTGFSAAGRVISTSNDMLNELLRIAR